MASNKWIKNASGGDKTYVGQLIQSGAYYQIQDIEEIVWAGDSSLLADIGSGDALVAKSDSGTANITDVNTAINYLKNDIPVDTRLALPFSEAAGYRFRGTGISGTVTAGTTGNVQYKMTENRAINAVHLLLENHVWDDTVKFQVVDVDGVYYPAGTVLDEFASTWNVDPTLCSQRQERIEYPATVNTGLYVRVVYVSTGGTDVKVKANLYLHKVPT